MGLVRKYFNNFMELTRGYSLAMIFASCFVLFSYANYCESFTWINFILLVVELSCVQMGANLFDDYIDIKLKLKQGQSFNEMVFSTDRKAYMIRNRVFSIKQVEIILIILFLIASIVGIYFAVISTWKVLIFALLGGFLTLFYPISSRYYLADIIVGIIFGPLVIMGGYYALCNSFNPNLFLMSFAICITTIILLHVHNIMDWEFDINNNKNTLAILCKTKQNAITALKLMIIASYLIVVIGVLLLKFNPHTLYVFLTLPIATKLLESINDYINIKDVKFEPRWYYGPFENWKSIQERKLDYFMYRFYLARNFSLFFAIFVSLGAMI